MCALLFCLAGVCLASAAAQQDRISSDVDVNQTVVLKDNVSPLAQPQNDLGPIDPSTALAGIRILFKPSAAQSAALKQLLAQQQNPASPNYHKWLTPEQYANRFGLSSRDIAKVVQWLESQGFNVTEVAHGRGWIVFSGSAAQVQSAFHTELHRYSVNGETHFANSTAPSIPTALMGVVSGFRGLNDFYPKPASGTKKVRPLGQKGLPTSPDYTSGGANYLAPDDLANIYDIAKLYSQGYDGTGEAIAVVGQSDIHTTDLSSFWTFFSLTPPTINQVVDPNTGDPGITGSEVEADLDLETVSGVARNATIYYVFGKNADDAAAYVIDNHTLIPVSVISESFGLCEPTAGTTYLTQQETIAEQGNSEGITWAASSGDTGAAACEPNGGSSSATTGLAVNEPASLPGVTGVGGTEFSADVTDQSQYWNTANTAIDESAISYIPEMAWNDSVGTGDGPLLNSTLSASGGGASTAFTKPSWQVGVGVPKDNARDVPDVSMTASANHDGYVIFCSNSGAGCTAATPEIVGGTSAATPLFSSILILLNHYLVKNGLQKTPGLTNVNQTLYQLAANSSSPFHDITTGSNIVPCTNPSPNCPTSGKFQFGFSAGVGYDQVTGLGSVDAYNFVIAWANSVKTPTTTAVAISTATVTVGSSVTLTATITPAPPDGETVTFTDTKSNATLGTASTASGKATFTSTTIAGGSYTVVASYPGDTTLASSASTSAQALNIQDFSLSPSTLSIAVSAPGQNGSGTITFGLLGGLSQAPSFSCSGLPSESTCTFTAASATSETVTIGTTPASWLHDGPLGRRSGIFYALLFPGLVGLVLPSGRRKRTLRVVLGLLAVFTVVTLWMPACGGSSGGGNHNPGTPVGQTSATVTASESGISHTVTINLNVQ